MTRIDAKETIIMSANELVETIRQSSDTFQEFQRYTSGKMEFGSGAGDVDTNLYRSAANTLKTDDALTVSQTLTASSNASVSGTLTASKTLTGSSNASISGTLTVSKTLTASSNATVAGTFTASKTLAGSSNATVAGTLTVSKTLTASSNATITKTLTGSSNATIAGTLTVSKTLAGSSNVTVSKTLTASSNVSITGLLTLLSALKVPVTTATSVPGSTGPITNNGVTYITSTNTKTFNINAPAQGYIKAILRTSTAGGAATVHSTGPFFDGTNDDIVFNAINDSVILVGLTSTKWGVIAQNSVSFS